MSSEFKAQQGNGWDAPDTLATFGINRAPSIDENDPLPAGLTRDESRRIREFIDAARNKEADARMKFIDNDDADASWAPHRASWRKWYKRLSPKVNAAVDKALGELETLPKAMIRQQDDDTFPELDNLVIVALHPVTKLLFGEYVCNGLFVKKEASPTVRMMLAQTYARHKRSWKKALTFLFGKVSADGVPLQEGQGSWSKLVTAMKGMLFCGCPICTYKSIPAEMEDSDEWDPKMVKTVLKMIHDIRGPLSWAPLLESQMQEWEAMIAGAASAAGLEIEHTVRASKDVVEHAEVKGA